MDLIGRPGPASVGAMEPIFFASPSEFRAWLEEHHDSAREVLVGYYKKRTGKPCMTWAESVDEALCFGWIDGVRRTIDEERYVNRFTPRTARSTWSARNIGRVKELTRLGRMHPAGLAAFRARADERSATYSYEQRHGAVLDPELERAFRRNRTAWAWFQARSPSYRKAAIHWVVSAKREEKRRRRLEQLIEDSAAGRTVRPLTAPAKRT